MSKDNNLLNHEVYDSFFSSEKETKRIKEKLNVPFRVWIPLPIAVILCIGSVFLYFSFRIVGFVFLVIALIALIALWIYYSVIHRFLLAWFSSLLVVGLPNAALGYWADVTGAGAVQLFGVPIGILSMLTFLKAVANFQGK